MVESGVVEDSGVLTFFLILTPWVTMVSWPLEAGEASCSGPHHCSWAGACCQASPEVKWLHNHAPQSSIYQVIIVSALVQTGCDGGAGKTETVQMCVSESVFSVVSHVAGNHSCVLCPVSERCIGDYSHDTGAEKSPIIYHLFFIFILIFMFNIQHWCCLRLCHDVVSCEVCGGNTWELPSSWLRH